MKPIQTDKTTHLLMPAAGDEEHVSPLPSYREDGAIVSIWEPTAEELERTFDGILPARRFGIQLDVLGDSPPVRVTLVSLHETPIVPRPQIQELSRMGGIPTLEPEPPA